MITKPKPGATINMAHPLSKGLVGFWLFNEGYGNLANDISGHGNHGVLKNMLPNAQGTKWAGSKFGAGLKFEGTNDYVDCGSDSSLEFHTNSFTLSAWIYVPSDIANNSDYQIITYGDTNDEWYSLSIWATASGLTFSFVIDDDVNKSWAKWQYGAKGAWYSLVGVRDTATDKLYLYVNGIEKHNITDDSNDISNPTYKTVHIGRLTGGGTPKEYYYGTIDQVRIYNRALSAQEIKTLYHDPFCNVLSAHTWQYYMAGAPPHTNLGIGGTITDPSGSVIEGAIIKIEDKTLSESLTNETSDINGEYAADLANLASQWNDADVLILKAEARGYRQTVVSAADASVPSLEINFDNAATRILMVM